MIEITTSSIRPSLTNPRTRMDVALLADLTESVRKQGVLQPVLVRIKQGEDGYELVCGHRRFAAAQAAGLEKVPAIVRTMDDLEALEVQVAENLQRADLHPLEEAESYQRLHHEFGLTVEAVALKVGKSKGYVYSRLQLAKLPEASKELMWKGEMNASLALLVARIPDADLQARAADMILKGHSVWHNGREEHLPLTYKQAAQMVREEFMLEMKGAPFNILDADLVPAAGPCSTCPKRTGNAVDLFGDVSDKDLCTDPTCFARKRRAAWDAEAAVRVAKLQGRKVTVLDITASEKIFAHTTEIGVGGYGPYVRPELDSGRGKKTWKDAVIAKAVEMPTAYLARHPKTGKPVEIWRRAEVEKLLDGKKKDAGEKAGEQSDTKGSAGAYDWEFENAVRAATDRIVDEQIIAKVRGLDDLAVIGTLRSALGDAFLDRLTDAGHKPSDPKRLEQWEKNVGLVLFLSDSDRSIEEELGIDRKAIEKASRKSVVEARKAKAAEEAAKKAAKAEKSAPKAKGAKKAAKKGGSK